MCTHSFQKIVGFIMNLINEIHHLYERREYAFIYTSELLNNHFNNYSIILN